VAGQAAVTTKVTAERLRLASPAAATVLGALVLALVVTEVALSFLTRNFVFSDDGAGPAALLAYAAVGVVVARRQPRNPIGWIVAAVALIGTVSQDIKLYVVLDYRLHHGTLPLGPVAASLTKTGILAELLLPLAILLFPDGRLPSRRWRWTLWLWLAGGSLSAVAAFAAEINGIRGQQVRVSVSGQLENTPAGIGAALAAGAADYPGVRGPHAGGGGRLHAGGGGAVQSGAAAGAAGGGPAVQPGPV
jgi:hypothetical protein